MKAAFDIKFVLQPNASNRRGVSSVNTLNVPAEKLNDPSFDLLAHLGFNEAGDRRGPISTSAARWTLEGAPHLKEEHYPVFDCANPCGAPGRQALSLGGEPYPHRMAGGDSPSSRRAISKTINMPNDATVEDCKKRLHALLAPRARRPMRFNRDGSKLSQPLNVGADRR